MFNYCCCLNMPESLEILSADANKEDRYKKLLPQIKSLISNEPNLIANLANVSAALKQAFNFWWVGFYLVCQHKPNELVLGPFQVSYTTINMIISIMIYIMSCHH